MPKDYPEADRVEVGIVGRSNAGKSSLINQILKKKQAFISSNPGKTILLNFYDIGKHYRLVDMPGYGYAKRSNKEQNQWRHMIETYMESRKNLAGILLLVDIQRKWQEEEQNLVDWCSSRDIPVCLVLTKMDKLKQSEKAKQYDYFLKASTLPSFMVSNTKTKGIQDLEDYVFNEWVKP